MTRDDIFELLNEVPDPEIPVISIVELGVVRDVMVSRDRVEVVITPTFSGCPAMQQMEDDVKARLLEAGFKKVIVTTVYQPAWTTDWMSAAAREKLRAYGIAPPEGSADKATLLGKTREVKCPRCGSRRTTMVSQFGSTACKALYQCDDCQEPFDYFKCH